MDSEERLLGSEEKDAKPTSTNISVPYHCRPIFFGLYLILAFLLGLLLSHVAPFYRERVALFPTRVSRVPIGEKTEIFSEHKEFMSPPPTGNGSEPVWDLLLPKGLGDVRNPNIPATRNISTIAVFHQLHCLYTLRRIYYSTVFSDREALYSFENGVDRSWHVPHCFEYLRQSLMCCADSSFEPLMVKKGDSPGMGFERQCRDYDELKQWAEEWRVLDFQSFILDGLLDDHMDQKQ